MKKLILPLLLLICFLTGEKSTYLKEKIPKIEGRIRYDYREKLPSQFSDILGDNNLLENRMTVWTEKGNYSFIDCVNESSILDKEFKKDSLEIILFISKDNPSQIYTQMKNNESYIKDLFENCENYYNSKRYKGRQLLRFRNLQPREKPKKILPKIPYDKKLI